MKWRMFFWEPPEASGGGTVGWHEIGSVIGSPNDRIRNAVMRGLFLDRPSAAIGFMHDQTGHWERYMHTPDGGVLAF